ncbi:hypothetical protein AU467_19660 [Mesorhizobium loti]|uniref:EamA domain-containing protein n=1 Tax=Rhizobium loti TaxID=381 RepID=A0A101KTQ4_RHILI|nr:hypothetical protein AU467_19660 [Mesorhizobium loti]
MAIALLAFIPACQLTSIANVAALYGTAPVFTALLGWLWLGEKIRPATKLAIAAMAAGAGVLVWGAGLDSDFVGNALAAAMTLMTAFVAVCIRRHREESLLPSVCAANVFVTLVSLCFATPLSPSLRHLVYLALFGVVQVGLAFAFYSAGARRVPASQASLVAALETPLAPFWVWLAFGETPLLSTLVGGGIITASTTGYLLALAGLAARRDADVWLSQQLQEGIEKEDKLNE